MAGRRRLQLGDLYEIPLPSGKKAYGRLFRECTLAIYQGRYTDVSELPEDAEYDRFLCVYRDLLRDGVWRVVGSRPFRDGEDNWPPPKCVVDAITCRGSLYEKGIIRPCTYAECKDLEIAAVWDRNHLVDMLMGDPKWDAAIRKPLP